MWVRRCWNEAADALSKNDMERFWLNVEGDRTPAPSGWGHTTLHHHSPAVSTALAQGSRGTAAMATRLRASTGWWHKAASANGRAKRSNAGH